MQYVGTFYVGFVYGICWYFLCVCVFFYGMYRYIDTFCAGILSVEYVGTFCLCFESMDLSIFSKCLYANETSHLHCRMLGRKCTLEA